MGYHICQFCKATGVLGSNGFNPKESFRFSPYSSADVTLKFTSGNAWVFPHEGLAHYIFQHRFLPPKDFVEDVLRSELQSGVFRATRGRESNPIRVGYLTEGGFQTGEIPDEFLERLLALIEKSKSRVDYLGGSSIRQTKG